MTNVELSDKMLLNMFYLILLSRRLDERIWTLCRRGVTSFHISGIGQEAVQVGAAMALKAGYDYVHPYYRDMALVLALGMTPREIMLSALGKQGDPCSNGRQMPANYSYRSLNIISGSSPVATQVPQAAGIALAIKMQKGNQVVLTCLGEGSTSQGDFFEGLNWASIHKLPLICLVQNNMYAISEPLTKQMAIKSVADRATAFNMPGVSIDGNDFIAVYQTVSEAVTRARRGEGPTLIEAHTYRLVPHSSSDDDRLYRSQEEIEAWQKKEPIIVAYNYLTTKNLLTDDELAALETEVSRIVDDAQQFAEAQPYPPVASAMGPVFAPTGAAKNDCNNLG